MTRSTANELAFKVIMIGKTSIPEHITWYICVLFLYTNVGFSKLCSFPVSTKKGFNRLVKHTIEFHGIDVGEVLSIVADNRVLATYKAENGYTNVPGKCGKCNQQIVDFQKSQNRGADASHFKRHLRLCATRQTNETGEVSPESDDEILTESDGTESINSDEVPLAIFNNPQTRSTRAHPRAKWYSFPFLLLKCRVVKF